MAATSSPFADRPKRPRRRVGTSVIGVSPLIRRWALRMLVELGGHKNLESAVMFNRGVIALLGLPSSLWDTPAQTLRALRRRLATAERQAHVPTVVDANIRLLGDALGLSALDRDLLLLVVSLHSNAAFEEVGDTLGSLDRDTLCTAVALVLGYPRLEVEAALRPDAGLAGAGLIRLDPAPLLLKCKFDLLNGLLDTLANAQTDPLALMQDFFREAPAPELVRSDFAGYEADYALLHRYLARAVAARTPGVNVLIYGPPGSGKTQLVRTLAAELRCPLFEVAAQNSRQQPLDGGDRLLRLRLAQRALGARGDALIVFDELEDVFPSDERVIFFQDPGIHHHKAWINQVLETNRLPTFWVGNSVRQLDPAYVRRFDFVLELRELAEPVRRKVLAKQLGALPIEAPWLDAYARNRALTPGMVGRAARVVAQLEPLDAGEAQAALERVTDNLLRAMELPPLTSPSTGAVLPYRLDILNAEMDPAAVAAGLARNGSGRLLCYGPPGTGKTAFAQHVAQALGRPLVVGRASDVLDKYVGGTEQRIRALFDAARAQDGVLLLDEIDGLLRTRDRAERSWELTQVNELLVQIEAFPGVLIACTNLLETLDPAALRRFDLKVRFDYLRPAQAWALAQSVLADRGVPADDLSRARLERLTTLTPGDFAAVLRRLRFSGEGLTAAVLVDALAQECAVKGGAASRGIGFAANL